MKLRIAIVEDEKEYVQSLQDFLERYTTEHPMELTTTVFSDGLDIVTDYTACYDIILLDIQMKHMDGMKAAEKIRELDEEVIFIFITSMVRFAVQGYMVDALGYVVKPVPYLAFSELLEKAVKQVGARQAKDYMTIEVESGYLKLDISQIYYIESQRHNIMVHTEKGDFITTGPLKKAEVLLSSKGFSKCHNAYLVNLYHVKGMVQNNLLLSGNHRLPVSRARKKAFMDSLADYMGGVLPCL